MILTARRIRGNVEPGQQPNPVRQHRCLLRRREPRRANGLDHEGAISLDNVITIPANLLGRTIGFLTPSQEAELARAVVLAYDLDIPLQRSRFRYTIGGW